jgi:hypothetical protein
MALSASAFADGLEPLDKFIGFHAGYSAGLPAGILGTDNSAYNGTQDAGTQTAISGTLGGQALQLGVQAGLFSENDHLGGELELDYHLGGKQRTGKGDLSGTLPTRTDQVTGMFIVPQFVFHAGSFSKWRAGPGAIVPFAKVGLVFGTGLEDDAALDFKGDTSGASHFDVRKSGGIAFGFTAALGAEYLLTPRMGLICEVSARSIEWEPTNLAVTGSSSGTAVYSGQVKSSDASQILSESLGLSGFLLKFGLNWHL